MEWVILIAMGIIIIILICDSVREKKMPPEEKERRLNEEQRCRAVENQRNKEFNQTAQNGAINAAMICPHCQTKGVVRTKPVK